MYEYFKGDRKKCSFLYLKPHSSKYSCFKLSLFFVFFFLLDQLKLNSGAWEDPLPLSQTPPVHSFRIRQSQPFSSIRRSRVKAFQNYFTEELSNTQRLEETVYARSISADDNWCNERATDHNISSDAEEDDKKSLSSITSANIRNNHLRSTFYKAKQRLSFDKWRHTNSNNSSHNTSANSMIMQPQHDSSLSPGETTSVGRLSRWFSIRRGSTHQYDFGALRDNERRASSVDLEDNSKKCPLTVNGYKMPLLPEVNFYLIFMFTTLK